MFAFQTEIDQENEDNIVLDNDAPADTEPTDIDVVVNENDAVSNIDELETKELGDETTLDDEKYNGDDEADDSKEAAEAAQKDAQTDDDNNVDDDEDTLKEDAQVPVDDQLEEDNLENETNKSDAGIEAIENEDQLEPTDLDEVNHDIEEINVESNDGEDNEIDPDLNENNEVIHIQLETIRKTLNGPFCTT